MVNHVFNSAFTALSGLPGGLLNDLVGGVLVLLRRSLFLVPEGVSASQVGNALTVTVNTGSVAYVRQHGDAVQISGDPWFFGARSFSDSTALTVEVSNPGNAGCAGVVLSAGTVNGALQTVGIDQLRFAPGAAFTQTVTATLADGVLTVRDAVRGLDGVVINAPVVLATDVEIDGGDQNVTVNGTVDAARSGRQSLTVTALGSTTFAAAVGGLTPLAGLLTRGVAPLSIVQSADTKTIPLRYAPEVSDKGKVQVKYGIDVAIGDNPAQLYEFDTGGNAFFAGYNPALWTDVPLTNVAGTVSYTSGNTYNFVVADGTVTLGSGADTVSTGRPIQVGAILTGGNDKKTPPQTFDFTNPDAPPIDGNFFGDFGASFDVFDLGQPNQSLLASPLLQLPGNLSSGFLVQLGPIGTTDPRLTVGITDTLRAQFPYAVPVTVAPGDSTYPVSGYPVLELFGIAPQYFAQQGDGPEVPIGCVGQSCPIQLETVIDSGAPSTGLRVTEGTPYAITVGTKQFLQPGVKLIAKFPTTAGRNALTWDLVAGGTPSVDSVEYGGDSVATSQPNVNTGLNLYNTFDVMFDAQQQIIWLRPNDGAATVVAGSVTTTGDQIYRQNARLAGSYATGGGDFTVGGLTRLVADTVVSTGSGDVSFFGPVDGSSAGEQSLTVNSTGATTFTRQVGENLALATFATDAGGNSATAGITTWGDQRFGDAVSLNGGYAVTQDGTFTVAGDATLAGPVLIVNSAAGQGISFAGRVDGSPTRGFPLSMSTRGGTIELGGDVGAAHPLGGLTVDDLSGSSATSRTTFVANGSLALSGGVGSPNAKGLVVGDSGPVTLSLTGGGVIQGFADSGVVIGAKSGGQLSGFAISNNGGDGIQANDTMDLTISGNVLFGNQAGIQIKSSSSVDARNAIDANTIGFNRDSGIVINTSVGNQIESNAIYGNGTATKDGITLKDGGNGGQVAPRIDTAVQSGSGQLTVTGRLTATPGYQGAYQIQVFLSPEAEAPNVQGRRVIGTVTDVAAGDFLLSVTTGSTDEAGNYITLTATPTAGPSNTSEFSEAVTIT